MRRIRIRRLCRRAPDESGSRAAGRGWPAIWGLLVLSALAAARASAAEDVVTVASANHPLSRTKLSGRIIDYTGRELTLELSGGTQRTFPAELVVEIQTTWPPGMQEGDALRGRRQFAAAYRKYAEANNREDRQWVRRKLMAQMVYCLRQQGAMVQAGEFFLLLLRADPATPDFDKIPLAWLPGEPAADLAQKAREWLHRADVPAAVLLGASHLLSTAQGPEALEKLRLLGGEKDSRIALLAEAQAWRTTLVTSTPEAALAWRQRVELLPEALRAGPYLVLGRALAYHKRYEDAALALLRVPILYPGEEALSAEALALAAQALERAGDADDAQRLRHEREALVGAGATAP